MREARGVRGCQRAWPKSATVAAMSVVAKLTAQPGHPPTRRGPGPVGSYRTAMALAAAARSGKSPRSAGYVLR